MSTYIKEVISDSTAVFFCIHQSFALYAAHSGNAMLTLDRSETISPLDYSILNSSIKETFTSIDRFEWQAVDEILQMREQQIYLKAGYKSFEQYCQNELSAWGGLRRINQLLGAKKVIDTVGELGEHIKNERQARPLLRLVKEPDKLKEAVAIAVQENPSPSESDFAAAAQKVVPRLPRQKTQEPLVPKIQEPMVPEFATVTVTSPSHHRHGESGTIEADPPNHWQQIVTFADGSKELVNNTDLDAPSVPYSIERTYPKEYAETVSDSHAVRLIAQIKEQHQQELERLEQELRIGLQSQATARAEEQVQEQLAFLQQLFQQQKEQNIQLQQRLDEMEALKQLEYDNQQLKQRIQELENAVQQRSAQEWGNTLTKQAAKALNKEVKRSLDRTIDLRSLAEEPPKENAQECLRLMGIALGNLASAMNNIQALQAAAIILGSEPTPSAIAYRAEQLQLIPQAVGDIRRVLSEPGCSWWDYLSVAQEYEVIKADYWAELTPQETALITALEKVESSQITEPMVPEQTPTESGSFDGEVIGLGSIVAHADIYSALYNAKGKVIEDMGDEVWVAWEHWQDKPKKTDRYFKDELRLL
jgi:DNA repair exonuclease SbcCD ATPase subunit